jgi:hypothetical protein
LEDIEKLRDEVIMEYIKSNNRKKYGREYVSIMAKSKKIIKNPGMKLEDEYRILCLVIFSDTILLLLFLSGAKEFPVCAFLSGIWLVGLIILCIRLISFRKIMKPSKNKETHFEFDEEGVILSNKEKKVKLKVYWEDFQYLRVYKYSIAFLPNKEVGAPLVFPIENYENIMEFLEEHHIEMQVIKK